uniref:ATP-dependent Clp protease proteolytic subunit n=1 Tax=Tylosema fassoglense TaxID=228518 RepID=A0A2S0SUJ5_9FABA|nr:clp protease proteolytic subunit [Tylosema fassoglense]YP_010528497.1 ATP-dependent Clp protease proteolytic subunit [Tylosema esculentum]AWB13138.1 clp protease proteolytic subunit [Tylosema fassoglense]UXW65311.1 ATP-dependent Clp protease proteolytic subunit [Tylosema esculentum]
MPIGVPKAAFLIPGDEEASWIDLYNRLYRDRLLFIGKEIKNELANQISGLMIFLSMEDHSKDQNLFLNSPGGWVVPGLIVYDTIQFVYADIQTINMGVSASIASFILAGGTPTKRIAFPHARVLIHQPASSFRDIYSGELITEMNEIRKIRENITKTYVEITGQVYSTILIDLNRDSFLSAEEAQTHGIIDFITNAEFFMNEKKKKKEN